MKTFDLAVMDEAQAKETVLVINRTQAKKLSFPKTAFTEIGKRWGKNKWELDLMQIEASRNERIEYE